MIKNIIFDMDGVLMNSLPAHFKAWKKTLLEVGIDTTRHEQAIYEGRDYSHFIDSILKDHDMELPEHLKKRLNKRKAQIIKQYLIKPYTIKMRLRELNKKGINMAVASGSSRKLLDRFINEHFPNLFIGTISGDDVKKGKPKPEPYLKALKLLKGKKEETLVIENAPLGIKSAKRAGLKVYAVETSLPRKYLKEADKIFSDHKKLFSYLKDHN